MRQGIIPAFQHSNSERNELDSMDNSTIAAIATPGGRGGIGIIKISGSNAVFIATAIFSPAEKQPTSNPGKLSSAEILQ